MPLLAKRPFTLITAPFLRALDHIELPGPVPLAPDGAAEKAMSWVWSGCETCTRLHKTRFSSRGGNSRGIMPGAWSDN